MLAIRSGTWASPSAARVNLLLSRRCANRYARITTPEARARGCRASLIAPVHRCGKQLANETIWCAGKPAIFALDSPKPPLGSFTKSTVVQEGPPRRPVETTRVLIAVWRACADCLRSRSVASALGSLARRDPGETVR